MISRTAHRLCFCGAEFVLASCNVFLLRSTKSLEPTAFRRPQLFRARPLEPHGTCVDPRPHAWSMRAACFCPCISQSRATPPGRRRYQTEFLHTSEFHHPCSIAGCSLGRGPPLYSVRAQCTTPLILLFEQGEAPTSKREVYEQRQPPSSLRP